MGSALIKSEPTNWKEKLAGLDAVDWTRRNARIWEGRALVAGRVSKATNNVQLTASFLKSALQVPLSKEDTFLEGSLKGSN
jgi:DNA sulfur modification protein DndB